MLFTEFDVEETVLENIKNLGISMDIPVEKAMDALKIPEEDRARYIDLIGDENNGL